MKRMSDTVKPLSATRKRFTQKPLSSSAQIEQTQHLFSETFTALK